tara:strand:+ start:2872 stop:3084 length:213 start_codon:yes stop_codon:yes gene_type:complete
MKVRNASLFRIKIFYWGGNFYTGGFLPAESDSHFGIEVVAVASFAVPHDFEKRGDGVDAKAVKRVAHVSA